MGEDVVGDDDVGPPAFVPELLREFNGEKRAHRVDPRLDGLFDRPIRGIDPQNGNPLRDEIPEQVAVVAGQLDHQAVRTQISFYHKVFCVFLRVLQ